MRKVQFLRAMREIGYSDYAIGKALSEIQELRKQGKRIRYEGYLPDWYLKDKRRKNETKKPSAGK